MTDECPELIKKYSACIESQTMQRIALPVVEHSMRNIFHQYRQYRSDHFTQLSQIVLAIRHNKSMTEEVCTVRESPEVSKIDPQVCLSFLISCYYEPYKNEANLLMLEEQIFMFNYFGFYLTEIGDREAMVHSRVNCTAVVENLHSLTETIGTITSDHIQYNFTSF